MSFALQWGYEAPENAGFIYFDSVTSWQQTYSGQVTKHPVDGGGNISDHFIRENPVFTLSGVISSVDVSTNAWLIANQDQSLFASNIRVPVQPVTVLSTDNSLLSKFIPNAIGQFIPDKVPDVEVDQRTGGQEIVDAVKDALVRLVYSGKTYNEKTKQFDSVMQTVTIFEYDNTQNIVRKLPVYPTEKIVITNIKFNEDVNTGVGLYCEITFEQVEFVSLQKTTVPKRPASAVKNKAAAKKNGGKSDSSVNDTNNPNNKDPQQKKDNIDASVLKKDPTGIGGIIKGVFN